MTPASYWCTSIRKPRKLRAVKEETNFWSKNSFEAIAENDDEEEDADEEEEE